LICSSKFGVCAYIGHMFSHALEEVGSDPWK
jgi:hypothetical protein